MLCSIVFSLYKSKYDITKCGNIVVSAQQGHQGKENYRTRENHIKCCIK